MRALAASHTEVDDSDLVGLAEALKRLVNFDAERVSDDDLVCDDDAGDVEGLGYADTDHNEHGLAHLRGATCENLRDGAALVEVAAALQHLVHLEHVAWHVKEALIKDTALAIFSLLVLQVLPECPHAVVAIELSLTQAQNG